MNRLSRMMTSLGLGNGGDEEQAEKLKTLIGLSVPVALDPCRGCANPCDEGHDEATSKLFVDHSTDLLGTVEPLGRQVSL